jgi:hypothetical protein
MAKNEVWSAWRSTRSDAGEHSGAFREVLWRKVREWTLFSNDIKTIVFLAFWRVLASAVTQNRPMRVT